MYNCINSHTNQCHGLQITTTSTYEQFRKGMSASAGATSVSSPPVLGPRVGGSCERLEETRMERTKIILNNQSLLISHWQKSQVRRISDCCSADFGPCLPVNQLYNNQNINKLLPVTVPHSPLSNALEVPFKTSRVRAATTSACLAIMPALSTASAPMEVMS